jgi:hypothetical protein
MDQSSLFATQLTPFSPKVFSTVKHTAPKPDGKTASLYKVSDSQRFSSIASPSPQLSPKRAKRYSLNKPTLNTNQYLPICPPKSICSGSSPWTLRCSSCCFSSVSHHINTLTRQSARSQFRFILLRPLLPFTIGSPRHWQSLQLWSDFSLPSLKPELRLRGVADWRWCVIRPRMEYLGLSSGRKSEFIY